MSSSSSSSHGFSPSSSSFTDVYRREADNNEDEIKKAELRKRDRTLYRGAVCNELGEADACVCLPTIDFWPSFLMVASFVSFMPSRKSRAAK